MLSAFVGLDKHATSPPPTARPKFWVSPLKKWLEGRVDHRVIGTAARRDCKTQRGKAKNCKQRDNVRVSDSDQEYGVMRNKNVKLNYVLSKSGHYEVLNRGPRMKEARGK